MHERLAPTRGDRRRRAILDAVEELLRDHSIAELSVEDIASAAGITRSGFYFYFDSKYSALGALLAGVWDEMAEAAAPFLEGSELPPGQYVRGALRDVGALWRTHEHVLVAMADAAATDPGARALWEAWIGRFSDLAAERIDAERAAGRAPAGPPEAAALARVLLAMNVGAFYADSSRRARGAERESTVEALAGTWLAAVWGERLDRAP